MKLAINQPYLFPYLGYFQLIDSVDIFLFYGNVKYVHRSWLNRNRILVNGDKNPYQITIPIANRKKTQVIRDVKISTDMTVWKKTELKRIRIGYARANYFDEIFPLLQTIILSADTDSLMIFNVQTTKKLCKLLNIQTKLVSIDENFYDLEKLLLQKYPEPNSHVRKSQRIFELAKYFNATAYHNLPSGTELYDKGEFDRAGLQLNFIKLSELKYPQFQENFVPFLSIIDVLMHNGIERTAKFIKDYQLLL